MAFPSITLKLIPPLQSGKHIQPIPAALHHINSLAN
jgi:hypothetical protein